jgi:cardiolipin synthase C
MVRQHAMRQYADRAGFVRSIMLTCTLALVAMLSGCTLPVLDGRTVSSAVSPEETRSTVLGQAAARVVPIHDGHSGIHPLADARHAFAARVLLTRNAERTLDVQYYIWRKDITGVLLLHEMQKAANRGVRVRLLLRQRPTPNSPRSMPILGSRCACSIPSSCAIPSTSAS